MDILRQLALLIPNILYSLALSLLSIYGLHALALCLLYLYQRTRGLPVPPEPAVWPEVTVQLPVYNERFVVERVIEAACAMDYPSSRLSIQVLDDSTDETRSLVQRTVEHYRLRGVDIRCIHREQRTGYKGGALAAALPEAAGELLAVLDADFTPPRDFLCRLVPYLVANPQAGMVQARWSHLNADYNLVTRGQAIFIDGHFVIEQTARSRSGLLFNFNGSGGLWRKSCIIDAGGWQDDTLAEDLDLSYRAQLAGWKLLYLPELTIPGEIPPQIAAFERQQYRWARASIQVLRKHARRLLTSRLPLLKRLAGLLHLTGYLTHPLMVIMALSSLPIVLHGGRGLPAMPWLALAGIGAPLLFALSQVATYPDWQRRLVSLPILLCLGVGMAFNNTLGVLAGFSSKLGEFTRTPKFHLSSRQDGWQANRYALHLEPSLVGTLILAVYSTVTAGLATRFYPPLLPVLILFSLSFAFVGLTGLLQEMVLTSGKPPSRDTTTTRG